MNSKIQTAFGLRRAIPPARLLPVLLSPEEIHRLAKTTHREAVDAEHDGRLTEAEMLFSRAVALRETAR